MNRPAILLIGAGGHARACIDVIEQQDVYRIAGLVGTPEQINTSQLGYIVLASDESLEQLAKSYQYALICVGQIESSQRRQRLYELALGFGFEFPCIVSPGAYKSAHASVGAGTILMHGSIVNAGARVGNNCIVNSRALIEHDCQIEDHCHISTGAVLNGGVTVGAGCFVGSGSVIKEDVLLGADCLIGMSVAVRASQPQKTRYHGKVEP